MIEVNVELFVVTVVAAVAGPVIAYIWGERRGFQSGCATMLLEMQKLGRGRIWKDGGK